MANNNIASRPGWANLAAVTLITLLLGAGVSNSLAQKALAPAGPAPNKANHGEILFTDSQSAILRADAFTGGPAVVAKGEKLVQPLGIAVLPNGEIVVSDTGCGSLLGVDLVSGNQRVIACGAGLGMPFGIAVERSGAILVANAQSLVRVNPETGQASVASSGQLFMAPIAVAVAPNRDIFVLDILGRVIRVNPGTGVQTLVSSGGYLKRPQGIAVTGEHIYVTDVATPDGNFGVGRIIHVDRQTGEQSVLAEGNYLVGPVGVTVDGGHLIVGDPYTINEASADLFDGGIIQVDRASGAQTLIARGRDGFVNPRCVAIIRPAGGIEGN